MTDSTPLLTPRQIEIADAALKVIGERGIAALTTAALAKELGVSSGAPFRHFTSRNDILEAAAQRVADLIADTYPDASLPPLARLEALFRARVATVGRKAGVARFIFSDQFALALPPAAVARIQDLVRGTRAFVLQALQDGRASGAIRGDLPPQDLAPIVMGSLQHQVFLSALPPGPGGPAPLTDVFPTLAALLAPERSISHEDA